MAARSDDSTEAEQQALVLQLAELLTEADAELLMLALAQRLGWSGKLYTRRDAEVLANRVLHPLSDTEWQRLRKSPLWLARHPLAQELTEDQLHEAITDLGIPVELDFDDF